MVANDGGKVRVTSVKGPWVSRWRHCFFMAAGYSYTGLLFH